MTVTTVAVVGAGSWGTALAMQLARSQPTRLWGRDAAAVQAMADARENARYLPHARFPHALRPEPELAAALDGVRDVLVVVPSHALRGTFESIRPHLAAGTRVAYAAKGFEPDTGKLPHAVAAEVFGGTVPVAVVSGPTFAVEVAAGLPTAIVVASDDAGFAAEFSATLHHDHFRAYTSDDVTGVEVGGAVKNVLAIAAGLSDGLGFGANARAAIVTRGLAEMVRFGAALGGRMETFMGLAGIGDLLLTCTSDQSRNRRFGLALGRGIGHAEAERDIGQVVEGIGAAREVMRLATRHGVEMPISEQVCAVVCEGVRPSAAFQALMARQAGAE